MKNKKLKKIVAGNIRTACKKNNVNSVELCKRSGKSPSSIARLMQAEAEPRLDMIEAVAGALDIDPWILFSDRMTEAMLTEERLPELARNFSKCSPDLKDSIMTYVAQMVELDKLRKKS
ncbi:MAG: hypothetical protein CSA52_02610 [Gammaproteobacteria bacterium]|nr:MAG: hypothetical protein CSB48_04280 [Pseudomonadota bacterium]PIE38293.1 MAG: hypothetical protein CSA52_02610 [Gammaproteobacteria bacterium]